MPSLARSLPPLAVAVLLLVLFAAIARLAWLGDEAWITLRCVDHLLAGHGPNWNVGERVQAFVHPLWFALLAAARRLTGEAYFTTLALGGVLAATATVLLLRIAGTAAARLAVLLLLLGSRAFVDFATSGLETPLAMVLAAWLARVDQRTPPGGARLPAIALGCSLVACTRLDLACFLIPLLVAHLRRQQPLQQAAVLGFAFAPLLAWSLFATWYYGTLVPMPWYADVLAPGVPAVERIARGWQYLQHAAVHDPGTLAVVAGGLVVGAGVAAVRGRMLALGIAVGVALGVRIGGDAMAGRALVVPFVLGLALLARWLADAPPSRAFAVAGFAAGLLWLPGLPAWCAPLPTAEPVAPREPVAIRDERRWCHVRSGLCSEQRDVPRSGWLSAALRAQGRRERIVGGADEIGRTAYAAGDLFHAIDRRRVGPLLARLPVADPQGWALAFGERALPDGYPEAVAFGPDRIEHAGLRRYYRILHTVLVADLDSPARWQALAALGSGDADGQRSGYAAGAHRSPRRRERLLDDLATAPAPGTFWFDDPRVVCLGRGGLRLRAMAPVRAHSLQLWLAPGAVYTVRWFDGTREVGRAECAPAGDGCLPRQPDGADALAALRAHLGLQPTPVAVPPTVGSFDSLSLDAACAPWVQPAVGCVQILP